MPAPYLGYQPNILVIRTDDAPIDCYTDQGMPTFAAGWISEFITFTDGVCNVGLCCPTRVAGLTGQTVWRHGVADNVTGDLMDTDATFLPACRKAGYYTAAVGKYLNADRHNDSVFAQNDTLGCDERYVFNGDPDYFNYSRFEASTYGNASVVNYGDSAANGGSDANYCTDVEKQNVLDIMGRAVAAGKKFCIYWAPKCAHQGAGGEPIPAPRHAGLSINLTNTPAFGIDPAEHGGPQWLIDEAAAWDSAFQQDIIATHKNALRSMRAFDEALDAIKTYLTTNSLLTNTVIILTTDNAHEYGDMRLDGKGTNRRGASGMLMLVRAPGASHGGETRTQVVGDFDLAPTVCALAGATLKVSPDGANFWPCVESSSKQIHEGIPLFSNRGGVQYLGWWDNQGYSSAVGLAGSDQEGQAWGWDGGNDFYMIENIGADHAGMVNAQSFVNAVEPLTTLA